MGKRGWKIMEGWGESWVEVVKGGREEKVVGRELMEVRGLYCLYF